MISKITAIIFCIMAVAYVAVARMNINIVTGGVPVVSSSADACATCPDGDAGGDVLCEDFEEEDEFLCTWGEKVIDTNDSIDSVAHKGSLSCTNKGSKALEIVLSSGFSDTYVLSDLGSAKDSLYTSFYVYIVSESLASSGYANIFIASSTSNASVMAWYVYLYQDGANLKFALDYYNGAGWGTILGDAISIETWYKVDVFHSYATSAVELWVNDSSKGSASDVGNRIPRYVGPGTTDNPINAAMTFQFDILKIDDDTRPSSCPTF